MSQVDIAYLLAEGQHKIARDFAAWLPQMLKPLLQLRTHWTSKRARAREMQALYSCSDRDLRDMGLSRLDFAAIRNGSYTRD